MRPDADTRWIWCGSACNNHCFGCPLLADECRGLSPDEIASGLPRQVGSPLALLVGGDPFTRPDIMQLVSAIRAGGAWPGLVTNGRALLYKEVRERLRRAGLAYLRVQLFGWGDRYDRTTGVRGAFEQVLAGLNGWLDEGGRAALDLALVPDPLDAAALADDVDRIAAAFPFPEIRILVSAGRVADDPQGRGSEALSAALARLCGWNRDERRPLLVWEGLPACLTPLPAHLYQQPAPAWIGMQPRATCLSAPPVAHSTAACAPQCTARESCPGLPQPAPAPSAASLPRRHSVANSFNYVRCGPVLPRTESAESCLADGSFPGEAPARWLLLERDCELVPYRTDTNDFGEPEVAEVKARAHLYLDCSAAAMLDDLDALRRVLPAPLCAACPRASRCGGRYVMKDELPFAAEEQELGRLVAQLSGRVLDIGCGEQPFREQVGPLARSGVIDYHGLDPDGRALARLAAAIPEGRYVCRTVEDFSGPRSFFDHVICLRAVNHLEDPMRAMANIAGLLKPGGQLLVAECTPFALLRTPAQVGIADRAPHAGQQHLRNWTSFDLVPLLRLHSMKISYHQPVTPLTNNQWVLAARCPPAR